MEMMFGGNKGHKVSLVQSKSRIAVRTKSRRPIDRRNLSSRARSIMQQTEQEMTFEGEDIQFLRSNEISTSELKEIFKNEEDELEFAGSVLSFDDSGEPLAYTERVFVALHPDASEGAWKETMASLGENWKVVRRLTYSKYCYLIEPIHRIGQEVFDRSMDLVVRSEVMRCHPEILRERSFRTVFPQQWQNGRRLINGQIIDQSANVDAAWGLSRGSGTTIAVIDDGVDIDHIEFNQPAKIVAQYDFTNRVADARPKGAQDNHGTACAGVACAAGVDGASGVAPDARLMPIRLRSGLGSIDESDAIMWAASNGADVISNSWGPRDGDWSNPNDPAHFTDWPISDNTALAIEAALNQGRMGRGCVICWAAGNGNESVDLDGWASFPGVTAVAASNDRGTRSVYSDTGDAIACAFPSNNFPDGISPPPLTPGIWTTDRTGRLGYNRQQSTRGNYTDNFGGTSSACPGAAGTAALVMSKNPMLTGAEVRNILQDTAVKIDPSGGKYNVRGHSKAYGYGRINAEKAVLEAHSML
jgi:subtilisin family serine protease